MAKSMPSCCGFGTVFMMNSMKFTFISVILVLVFVTCDFTSEEHLCSHLSAKHDEAFYDVDIEPRHEIFRRSVEQPLRIHLHFDKSVDQLPRQHALLIKTEVEKAAQYWRATLRVRATRAPIRLRRQCGSNRVNYLNQRAYCMNQCSPLTVCGEIVIPNQHLEGCYRTFIDRQDRQQYVVSSDGGPGVNETDFILYIASFKSERCQRGRTVAYAAHCQQERVLDRPVAGYFSICPQSIADSWQERQQLLSTMKHEILHALGFTAGLYAFYRDDYGNPLTERSNLTGRPLAFDGRRAMYMWSDRVVRNFTRNKWDTRSGSTVKMVNMIVTKRVKREVQQHFGCDSLEGAELEDQGIEGTAITHWEKRIFENEAMTGTYTQNSVISRITLAMMEDTGWYKANYSQAGDYEWGKGLGCEFVHKSCYHWISTRLARNVSIYPYCRRVKRGELLTDCTHNRHAVALCNLVEYKTDLPVQYQYFSEGQLEGVSRGKEHLFGGSVSLADYCPYLQEFTWTSIQKTIRGSSCVVPANSLKRSNNFFGEFYGARSRCFQHDGQWLLYKCDRVNTPQHSGSGCYQVKCDSTQGLLLLIGNQSYPCYHKGYIHHVAFLFHSGYLHKGAIVCPDCNEICPDLGVTCPGNLTRLPSPTVDLPIPCRGSIVSPVTASIVNLILVLDVFFDWLNSRHAFS